MLQQKHCCFFFISTLLICAILSNSVSCTSAKVGGHDIKIGKVDPAVLRNIRSNRIVNDPPPSPGNCTCGVSPLGPFSCSSTNSSGPLTRIVGGAVVAADSNKHPWQAFVQVCEGKSVKAKCYMCGGTLVSRRWVLTAAHCCRNPKSGVVMSNIMVSLGDYDLRINSEVGQRVFRPSKVVVHPEFDPNVIENDIALLMLDKDVDFSDQISPACIPSDTNDDFADVWAVVSGWGSIKFQGSSSPVLREAAVKILDSSDPICKSGVVVDGSIPKTKLCAYAAGKDACQGDSGGPLTLLLSSGQCAVVGIVSYGMECASENSAGVYTRVTQFVPWIKSYIGEDICAASPPSPEVTATTGKTTVGACDLTCTNAADLDGDYMLNDIPASCKRGFCTSLEDGVDLCEAFGYPCSSSGVIFPPEEEEDEEDLNCNRPCNLSFFIFLGGGGDAYTGSNKLDTIIDTSVCGVQVRCDRNTWQCCQWGNPTKENLCMKVFFSCLGFSR